MTFEEKVDQKRGQILGLVKCMRIAMSDAAAANDAKLKQAYWNTAERWGRKVDTACMELELLTQKQLRVI
jgi:hypothetical protein